MTAIKLTYFDMHGGRGEPVRIALHAAGVSFDDERLSFKDFFAMRSSTPLDAVPVMTVDGTDYTQSNSMLRYVGRQAGLYPDDSWQAFLCDEIMDVTEDLLHQVVATFGLEGDALKTARQSLVEGGITRYLKLVDTRLTAAGGRYLAGNQLTVADLKTFIQLRAFAAGVLDHVPTDICDTLAPSVAAYGQRIGEEPIVTAYYASLSG
ncbi:MAG: glutathione S-transferase family protein [Pseudomonadota bacterium]